MIHIKFGNRTPSQEWLEKAQQLSEQLDAAASKEERDKIIDDNRQVWGELKDWLLQFSHDKCWFSEAKDTYSHWDVEHFRPKKSAKNLDGTEREGYWWLAFDWHNYRICGNVGNRKKGTFFPLHPTSQVATSNARHLVQDEIFFFLDPTREGDPDLLSFDEEGLATAMSGIADWPEQRVEESIKRFKLNGHEPLRKARQKVWKVCRRWIEGAREALETDPPTANSQEKLRTAFEALQDMLSPTEPFTAVTRECLNSSGYRWAQRIASAG
jgi:hypothetical protein